MSADQLTDILRQVSEGDEAAKEALYDHVFHEMREMAAGLMRRQPLNHTLQPTALVNEAVLRLINEEDLSHHVSRSLFFWTVARTMRRILADHARQRKAIKRGGDQQRQPLDVTVEFVQTSSGADLIDLDDALTELENLSQRQAKVVELRFFGGFEMQEIADQLDVSLSTVEKDWRLARSWLRTRL